MMSAETAYISKYIGDTIGNVEAAHVTCMMTMSASVDIWHHHLGHISIESILKDVPQWHGQGDGHNWK